MLCAFIRRPTVADQMNQKQSAADSTLSPLVCSVEMPLTALLVAVRKHPDSVRFRPHHFTSLRVTTRPSPACPRSASFRSAI
jgi:hypothetical protein